MTRAEVVSTIRINTIVVYFLVEFMKLWSTYYTSPSYRIQKIHRFHWIFDAIVFTSTFIMVSGLPSPIAFIAGCVVIVLDIGFAVFMGILLFRCQNSFKNVCFRTLLWDYGLIVVLGIIIFLEFQTLININILKQLIIPGDNLETSYIVLQKKMRLRLIHIMSIITSVVLLFIAWYTQSDFLFRNENSEDYYLSLNILLTPGLIWLAKKKQYILKFFALVTSIIIFIAHVVTFYKSFIAISTTSTYKEIKYKLMFILLSFDIIIIVTHINIVWLTPSILTKWNRAGESIKWWFIRQNERINRREIKTS
jgi:hypothetical protein